MIAIGKKDPAVEQRKKSASMPPMLKFAAKEEAPATAPAPEPKEPVAPVAEVEPEGDYGTKLMADVEAAGQRLGLDPSASRAFAADVFGSVAECLRGGSEPESAAEPALGDILG